jgi:hypothetical protein
MQGTWIISHRNIGGRPHHIRCKWTRTAKPTQCNKKISKKCWASMENHEFWSPDCTFQWCFYGGIYIEIFWGSSVELARPGRGNVYKVAQGQHPLLCAFSSFDCWEPPLSKKYRVDRVAHNISGSTIFKFFKSRVPGCTAAGRIP